MKKEVKKTAPKKNKAPRDKVKPKPTATGLEDYGLEPPKIYRADQVRNKPQAKDDKRKSRSNNPKTVQQERIEENKRRRQKKKIRKLLLYFILVVGIIGVMIVLSLTVLFKTQTITITGNSIYSKKEITAVLPIQKEKNLFLADVSGAEKKLEENLPYIYNAEIKRKLPSTIVVNIEETPQVYAIKNKDKTYTLVDDNFKVLQISAKKPPKKSITIKKAALFVSETGKKASFTNKKVEEQLKILISQKKKMKLDKITELYSADINNNYMVYDSRITIKLGTVDGIEDKLYSALAAIEKLEKQNPQIEGELTVSSGKQVYFTEK